MAKKGKKVEKNIKEFNENIESFTENLTILIYMQKRKLRR